MKKTLLLFFLSLSLSGGALSAREITAEQARQTATRFWQSSPATRGGTTPSWQLVRDSESTATRSSGANPAYYVFDNTAGPGFVIVAGDDVAMPVLGYSFPCSQGNTSGAYTAEGDSVDRQVITVFYLPHTQFFETYGFQRFS